MRCQLAIQCILCIFSVILVALFLRFHKIQLIDDVEVYEQVTEVPPFAETPLTAARKLSNTFYILWTLLGTSQLSVDSFINWHAFFMLLYRYIYKAECWYCLYYIFSYFLIYIRLIININKFLWYFCLKVFVYFLFAFVYGTNWIVSTEVKQVRKL